MIHLETLQAVLGEQCEVVRTAPFVPGEPLRSPGQLSRHYSPRARLLVWEWRNEADLKSQLARRDLPAAKVHIVTHTHIPPAEAFGGVSVIPHDPEAFARALYATLHHCDEMGADWIVVEAVPADAAWQGIADRVRRAAQA
jgi:L-threonylcarbamoyladenylate synthase